ncbi:hydroxymethylglutaryl-CoA lyase [Brevibacterium sp. S22]|nr:hydroxymethylglutaryl-CoA lyase [Brevibacterium sp. S22]
MNQPGSEPIPPLWEPKPLTVREESTAEVVSVYEVAPRDGLQAETVVLDTDLKTEFCERLWASGVSNLEVTSFVPPAWIPQLADAEDLAARLEIPDRNDSAVALVPNIRGLERAYAAGFRAVAAVASCTESFARANLNTNAPGTLARVCDIASAANSLGISVRGYLSMAFGDPWEGHVDPARVADLTATLYEAGCQQIALGDTIGTATPGHVRAVLRAATSAGVPTSALALHLHDTYGLALANVYSAMEEGITTFDASAGGLGRCPYAPGAAGNLATEDLVWLLDGLGVETGINLDDLVATSLWFSAQSGRPAPSRVVSAYAARLAV